METLLQLLQNNRSYRRFDEKSPITKEQITRWVSAVRYTSSAKNEQPLKYFIATDEKMVYSIFKEVHWAAYLRDWDSPAEGERPVAFLVQLLDTTLSTSSRFDEGIQLEAITLMATADGYGACIMAAFDKRRVMDLLQLPEHLHPITIIALGKPIEKVVIEDLKDGDSVRYYRTEDSVHHVPKRLLEDLIVS